jgi:hypothetical protein
MQNVITACFLLGASLCWAQEGSSALEVHGASPKVWRTVKAVVHSYGMQQGFRLARQSPDKLIYDVDPRGQPQIRTLFVTRGSDTITVDVVEDARHPSRRHRTLERHLQTRLKSAGLRVSWTESHILITH